MPLSCAEAIFWGTGSRARKKKPSGTGYRWMRGCPQGTPVHTRQELWYRKQEAWMPGVSGRVREGRSWGPHPFFPELSCASPLPCAPGHCNICLQTVFSILKEEAGGLNGWKNPSSGKIHSWRNKQNSYIGILRLCNCLKENIPPM